MINDDEQVGRVLSRREVLKLLGGASAALIAGCGPRNDNAATPETGGAANMATPAAATAPVTTEIITATETPAVAGAATLPSCIVRPELTEGPYFVDSVLNRSDIRANTADSAVSEGIPLSLTFLVSQVNDAGCVPLPGAQVDIWHCDVQGVYSGVNDPGFSTANQDFLRGYLVTDENGAARFDTIYPGWYPGRAVHIHFKIRTDPQAAQGYDFTSQLFFEDSLNGDVFARSPYAVRGDGWLRNERDGIFQNSGGQLTLHPEENDGGFNATFDIGLQI